MIMDKRDVAIQIYKSTDKALTELIKERTKEYLKKLKGQAWYKVAFYGIINISKAIQEVLMKYSKRYAKAIQGKKEKEVYRAVDEVSKSLATELIKFYDDNFGKTLLVQAADKTAKEIGVKYSFNSFDMATRDYLKDKKINWSKQVTETTEKRVKELLTQAFEEGTGSYDLADLLHEDSAFSYSRAEAIARTEVISACNYADNTIYQIDDSIIGKKWSATADERTRLNHAYADGQIVPKDKPFIVGGYEMMYPGDSALGAPAGEVINCRCTTMAVFEGEHEFKVSDTIINNRKKART